VSTVHELQLLAYNKDSPVKRIFLPIATAKNAVPRFLLLILTSGCLLGLLVLFAKLVLPLGKERVGFDAEAQ
jgi:hypothetical protein